MMGIIEKYREANEELTKIVGGIEFFSKVEPTEEERKILEIVKERLEKASKVLSQIS